MHKKEWKRQWIIQILRARWSQALPSPLDSNRVLEPSTPSKRNYGVIFLFSSSLLLLLLFLSPTVFMVTKSHSVVQVGPKLPVLLPAPPVLLLQVCAAMPGCIVFLNKPHRSAASVSTHPAELTNWRGSFHVTFLESKYNPTSRH